MKTGPTGVWLTDAAHVHRFDDGLATALIKFFACRGGDVIDIGCGNGAYVRALRTGGIACDGYDGNPNTPEMTDDLCGIIDFSSVVRLSIHSWVLSLEVGEHIPAVYERNFIVNLHVNNINGVVLSWAVHGQGGAGHVNERSNDYIHGAFAMLGYVRNFQVERVLRDSITTCPWFMNTIMVFEYNHGF